ncbi:hypothetical protein PTTG_06818 [Puccinia triticina 1-1 BBBD Race 1]|uniref:thioredoxin-dependent peroxiredoxin n=2 Tax=Puccinia triticina TaxID=208348 RepID=A0A0C4F148_PUCT1|nr:uncharacterized protein PtA15_8A775 [Puccinia triticina]OAV86661.1 hypothetical protein PTTG_06818 [Puccinia triticina 1-1 BBBD Race 1]WAQ87868.1 hypothetical protein PtA15_8A775 [Puccinia triticina]WAR57747.1 hypothetical protein PtB15_8B800 [Puccinia triticina]
MAPKKRGAPESGSEAAPRRSTRVSAKPVPAVDQKQVTGKTAKPNGKAKKATTQTKPSKQPVAKADADGSLSELSAESQVKDLEEADSMSPPKKKSKVDKTPPSKEGALNSKKKLAIGDKLPESIILKNHDDADVDVLGLTADKGLIMFIYPKSNTPGCTTQACGYRDLHKEIVDAGFQVVGLSMDSPKAQTTWKVKQNLPYTLLCDPEQRLIKLLGSSKNQSSVQRSHFIFEAGGKLIQVDPKATTTTSPKQALDFIQSLANGTAADTVS